MTHRSRARIAFVAACACITAIAVALATCMWFHERAANVLPSPRIPASLDVVSTPDSDGFPVVDWGYWQAVNPDVIGWVTVPETDVNYPIVQAHEDDPGYYLLHDVYGGYNVYGCPYLDPACAGNGLFGSRNAVVFGHHMNDGSMFAAFASYSDEDFAKAHDRILIQTPMEQHVYLVQGADVIPGWESLKRTEFNNTDDFATYYAQCLSDCDMRLADTTASVESMITFCTCSYHYWSNNERTLVYAVND